MSCDTSWRPRVGDRGRRPHIIWGTKCEYVTIFGQNSRKTELTEGGSSEVIVTSGEEGGVRIKPTDESERVEGIKQTRGVARLDLHLLRIIDSAT